MSEKKAQIAVLVSGGGTNLQAILDEAKKGNIPHGEVTLVISDRAGAYALTRAEQAGIPAIEIIHPSLIPSFCGTGYYGLKVHEAALKRGVKVTGATVHFVNEIPDGGEIIAQRAVEIQEGDTPEILQRRVMEQAEWIILPESVEKVCTEIMEKRKE